MLNFDIGMEDRVPFLANSHSFMLVAWGGLN